VEIDGKTHITPLFLVLLVIESTDLLFAVDSVPAIIGVVGEHVRKEESAFMFIAFTSNVFAILGLRALYFLLARSVGMFRYLNAGLALVLMFIGVKMMADYAWAWYHPVPEGQPHAKLIPPWVSITVIFGILTVAVVASLVANRLYPQEAEEEGEAGEEESGGGAEAERVGSGERVGEGNAAN
jgi:tellurite resistance protein TerC